MQIGYIEIQQVVIVDSIDYSNNNNKVYSHILFIINDIAIYTTAEVSADSSINLSQSMLYFTSEDDAVVKFKARELFLIESELNKYRALAK